MAPNSSSVSMTDLGPVLPQRERLLSRRGTIDMKRVWDPHSRLAAKRHKVSSYGSDLFHTMVHQPWWRLLLILFFLYIGSWVLYAAVGYFLFPRGCIRGGTGTPETRHFRDWLNWTIQTMSTIGYGTLTPGCPLTQSMVPVMLVNAFVLDAVTFGFVFAKFSAPTNRASTLLFSKKIVGTITRKSSGALDLMLSFRLVNTRKHPVAAPDVRVYLVDHRPLDFAVPQFPRFHEIPAASEPPLEFLEYPCTVSCHFSTPSPSTSEDVDPQSPHFRSFLSARTPRRFSNASDSATPAPENAEGDTPLHELLLAFGGSGEAPSSWPRSSEMQQLEALSLVVLFSAQIYSTGASFELRKSYPLLDTAWGCEFRPMLSGRRRRQSNPGELAVPQTILDISLLGKVQPLEALGGSANLMEVAT